MAHSVAMVFLKVLQIEATRVLKMFSIVFIERSHIVALASTVITMRGSTFHPLEF